MITKEELDQLNNTLLRVFSLPMSRLTLREVQNAISTSVPGNIDIGNKIYNSFLTGNIPNEFDDEEQFADLVNKYSVQVRIAKEVAELGEFMNIFSCDFVTQGNQVYFDNRMRRLDGQEYHFLSAPDTNIRLAHM